MINTELATSYFGDWLKLININILSNTLNMLCIRYKYNNVVPTKKLVFRAFKECSYDTLSVVIIGQDPYPQYNTATGIAFGNDITTEDCNLSPSLKIIKDSVLNLENINNNTKFDPSLLSWCKQGILLLNSSLTTEINKTGAHTLLWRKFITDFLNKLSNKKENIIYILFGEQAKTMKPYINNKNNIILTEKHPAYYARINSKMPFTVFKRVNEILKEKNKKEIYW